MQIDSYRFGRIVIDGEEFADDVILVADRVVSPWWREAGGHLFATVDLRPVFEAKPGVVVLGLGRWGRVRIADGLHHDLAAAGIEVVAEPTPGAVATFNRLDAGGASVAAALHLTC